MKHARRDYDRIQDPEHKIPEEEPVFLLRGQDKLAPDLIRQWALQLLSKGGSGVMAEMAMKHADKMEAWQTRYGAKVPDL